MRKILFLLLISSCVYGSYNTTTTVKFDPSNLSAFGDLSTNQFTPIFQFDFVYGILSNWGSRSATGTGALVDTSLSRLRVQSGTSATTGTALFTSYHPARYRAGQGVTARFTAVFDTGQTGNVQEIGMMTSTDGYAFGYNGTSFGILHRNSSSGSLSNTWVPQSSWNGDKCDGTGPSGMNWHQTKGNVCMIHYPYLGYGNIQFFVEDSATGRFLLCHTICYTNTSEYTQLSNPTLNFWARSANTGANTTNTIIYVGSVGVFINGERLYTSGQFGIDTVRAAVTTEAAILNIRNCTTFNGVTEKGVIRLSSISFGGHVNGNPDGFIVIRFKINATLGGDSTYRTISGTTSSNGRTISAGQSIASYNASATTVTGGTRIFSISVNVNSSNIMDLVPYGIEILPGETLTISAYCSSSYNVWVTANWEEDI